MKSYFCNTIFFVSLFLLLTPSVAKEVTLQLHLKNQFQFAGYYMAKERGFYKESDLDVAIKEYQDGVNVIDDVIGRKSEFGVDESFLVIEKIESKEVVDLNTESLAFDSKEYGVDFYNATLFTSEKFLKQNPKVVKEFLRATIKGWQYTFEHLQESSQLIFKKYNSQQKTLKSLLDEGEKLKQLAYKSKSYPLTNTIELTPQEIEYIKNKKFVSKEGSALLNRLISLLGKEQVIATKTMKDSFKMLSTGEAYGTIATLPEAHFYIKRYGYSNLKISLYPNTDYPIAVVVRNDDKVLLSILNRVLKSISEQEKLEIFDKWSHLKVEKEGIHISFQEIFIVVFLLVVMTVISLIFINRTLTKKVEKQTKDLIEAKKQAEVASRTKSLFLANMSHEIRTPMNAVLGFCEILEKTDLSSVQKSYLDAIRTGSKNLLAIINDILDFSKIEAGKMVVNKSSCDVKELLLEVENLFKLSADNKGIIFQTNVDEELPKNLLLDEVKLKQILINIISNGIKFTDRGEVIVNVVSIQTSKEYCNLLISVIDTGKGIKQTEIEKIFDTFAQQDNQDSKKYGGTGLGLSITKKLIEILGGEIEVTSEFEKGTTFKVKLNNVEIVKNTYEKKEVAHILTYESGSKILVVDDEDANRKFLVEYLKTKGFIVLEAKNGKEALEETKLEKPLLIISDLRMPIMNGYELVKNLRECEEAKNIPVVALTASVLERNKEDILESGFKHFLRKPLDFDELEKILQTYLTIKNVEKVVQEDIKKVNLEEISNEDRKTLERLLLEAKKFGDFSKYEEVSLFLESSNIDSQFRTFFKNAVSSFDIKETQQLLQLLEHSLHA